MTSPASHDQSSNLPTPDTLQRHRGGVIHTYQQYDPKSFPSPSSPPPDLVSPAFEHMLTYGSTREFTEEELAKAIHLDPGQFAGLGPSLDALLKMLQERKAKILSKYETDTVQKKPYVNSPMPQSRLSHLQNSPNRFGSPSKKNKSTHLKIFGIARNAPTRTSPADWSV